MFRIFISFVAASAALIVMTGNATAQNIIANRPNLNVGDSWQYQFKNTRYAMGGCEYSLTVEKITEINIFSRIKYPDGCDVSVTTAYPVASGSLQKYDLDFNHFHHSKTAYKAFAFPLEVGKTWFLEYEWKLNGWTYNDELTGRVDAFEKVTTPAGTFDAFKISLHRKYLGTKTGGPTQSGVLEDTFWYSPEVKNFVKRIYSDGGWANIVRELVKFDLHQ